MASTRPFQTLYAPGRRKPASVETAMCVGRACSVLGALRGALTKMKERGYVRADVYNDWGVHLYTLTKQAGGITIARVRGEAL